MSEETIETAPRGRMRLLLVAVVSATLLLGGIFGRHGLLEVRQYRAERARLVTEIAALEAQVAALESEIRELRANPAALERVAREELTMARPGEYVVLLPPSEDAATATTAVRP